MRVTNAPKGSGLSTVVDIAKAEQFTTFKLPQRWGWVEMFVVVQNLSMALLFIPGSQLYRPYIRALPYLLSISAAALLYNRRTDRLRLPPGGEALIAALILLFASTFFHPTSAFPAGLAQCLFQVTIAAPIFWAADEVRDPARLNRVLWLIFLTNAASALVGLLQVYYPSTFMPPAFSSLALSMNPEAVNALTYVGAAGQKIIRPVGLTDLPGGAAVAGLIVGLLGLVFAAQPKQQLLRRVFCLAMAVVGISVLFLTQVRSLIVMLVFSALAMCALFIRQARFIQSAVLGGICVFLLVGSFLWAAAIGGKPVTDRFSGLIDGSPFLTFQQNRGIFVKQTFDEILYEYPFGAGAGRWGMMNVYFGGGPNQPPPIWAEIQLTGWLLDGGVLMWVLYGGAVLLAMAFAYRLSISLADRQLNYLAAIVLCLNFFVAGQSFGGPVFNTQLGIQFWFLTAALYGVSSRRRSLTRHSGNHGL